MNGTDVGNIDDKASFLKLSQLNAVRLLVVLSIGIGCASTMPLGETHREWGYHWGYDLSWFSIQVLFALSGVMAMRSLMAGRTGWAYLKKRALRTYPLVILYTAAIVSVLYPWLCASEARTWDALPKLTKYFFETSTLIRPGQPLPGLLDDALYMCLLQGTMWTLRWGAIFHIGLAIAWKFGWLQRGYVLLSLTGLGILAYLSLVTYNVKTDMNTLSSILPGLKLGYAFASGMCLYAYHDKLPQTWQGKTAIAACLALLATLFSTFIPADESHWLPGADLFGTLFWIYIAFLALQTRLPVLQNWPNLVLGTYLAVWPITQVFLYIEPNISIPALVLSSCICAIGMAVFMRGTWRALSQQSLSRKVAINSA